MGRWPIMTLVALAAAALSTALGLFFARKYDPAKGRGLLAAFMIFWPLPMAFMGLVDIGHLVETGEFMLRVRLGLPVGAVMALAAGVMDIRVRRRAQLHGAERRSSR